MPNEEERFAWRMGIAVADVAKIAQRLEARSVPHDSWFVIRDDKNASCALVLKVPARGGVYFSFMTYGCDVDCREGLREYLLKNNLIGEFDGMIGIIATNKANTSNGKVCDFKLCPEVLAKDIPKKLDQIIAAKNALLSRMDKKSVFNVPIH